jgi:tetratricopeptide (TPR) repeat protein
MSRLRAALGDEGARALVTADDRILLAPDVTTDLEQLERFVSAADRCDPVSVSTFLQSIPGPFLDDLELAGEAEYEAWRISQSANCRGLLSELLKQALSDSSGTTSSAELSRHLVAVSPGDEEAWALLVERERRHGHTDGARRLFLLARRHLQREGVEPTGLLRSALGYERGAGASTLANGGRPSILVDPVRGPADLEPHVLEACRLAVHHALQRNGAWQLVERERDGRLADAADFVLHAQLRSVRARLQLTLELVETASASSVYAWELELRPDADEQWSEELLHRCTGRFELDLILAQILLAQTKPATTRTPRDRYHLALASIYAAQGYDADATLRALQQVIDEDASIAGAHCAMGWVRFTHPDYNGDPDEIAQSGRLARLAVDLAGRDAFVIAWSAVVLTHAERDPWTGAEIVERALGLNPDSPMARIADAWITHYLGDFRASLASIDRIEGCGGAGPLEFFCHTCRAMAHYQLGDAAQAVHFARRAVGLNPGFVVALRYLAAALVRMGEKGEAREVARRMLALDRSEYLAFFRRHSPYTDRAALERLCADLAAAGIPEQLRD